MSAKPQAAVGSPSGKGRSSAERRKEIRGRLALGGAALLLLAAVVVFLESRTGSDPGPTPQAAASPAPVTSGEVEVASGGTLEPEARKVAIRFLQTAVGRTEPDEAWALATPEFRQGTTLAQWRAGELPVPPFPVDELETTGFTVVGSAPNKVLIQVLLVPRSGTEYVPTRYDMTLERASASAPWKVSYCTPYGPPGMYVNPE